MHTYCVQEPSHLQYIHNIYIEWGFLKHVKSYVILTRADLKSKEQKDKFNGYLIVNY